MGILAKMHFPPINHELSLPNALWSLGLFVLAVGIIFRRDRLLRASIHDLVVNLPHMGSEFIRQQLSDLREDLNETRANVQIIKEHVGLNGEELQE